MGSRIKPQEQESSDLRAIENKVHRNGRDNASNLRCDLALETGLGFWLLKLFGASKGRCQEGAGDMGSKVSQGADEMKRPVSPSGTLRVNLLVNFLAARLLEALI